MRSCTNADPKRRSRQFGLDLVTTVERRGHQLLALGESAPHHCAHRGAHLGDPLPERLAQLVGESSTYGKLALHRGHVAELAVVVREEVVTEDRQLPIVRTFAERAQLVARRDAFVPVGRRPADDVPDVQRARERRAVARPPRRLDRGGRELPAAVDRGSEQQGMGQTRHQARPDGFVIVNVRGERFLEQVDERDAREPGFHVSAEAERARASACGSPAAACGRGRGRERLGGCGSVTGT